MNRSKLLKAARALGFKGATLDELKKWAAEENIEITHDGKSVDLDAAWAAKATVTIEDDDAGDEDEAARKAKAAAAAKAAARTSGSAVDAVNAENARTDSAAKFSRLASARKAYNQKAARGAVAFDDAESAELWAASARLQIAGHNDYPQRKADTEIVGKAMAGTSATGGSAMVPVDYIPEPIRLREKYGLYSQLAQFEPMSRDSLEVPNELTDVTVYFGTEGSSQTDSTPSSVPVTMTARKLYALVKVSSELFNDAAISIADRLAESSRYAMDKKIDECFFVGDGTSTYGHITGVTENLKNLSGTIANISGLKVGTGNAYSELVIGDFDGTDALLPASFEAGAVWVMSKTFWSTVAFPVWRAAYGGATPIETGAVASRLNFYGKPVVIAQAMPKTAANSQVCCLLGDFKRGSKYGIVNGSMRFESSNHRFFDNDQIVFRATERIAINSAFGVGNATATAADKQPGPIVGLITAAA